jgi:hypothetical protein
MLLIAPVSHAQCQQYTVRTYLLWYTTRLRHNVDDEYYAQQATSIWLIISSNDNIAYTRNMIVTISYMFSTCVIGLYAKHFRGNTLCELCMAVSLLSVSLFVKCFNCSCSLASSGSSYIVTYSNENKDDTQDSDVIALVLSKCATSTSTNVYLIQWTINTSCCT